MNLLTFNAMGVCNSPKRTYLKRILESVNPSVVLLQETMVDALGACDFFLRLKPSWKCCVLDSLGLSRGLLLSWDPLVSFLTLFLLGLV